MKCLQITLVLISLSFVAAYSQPNPISTFTPKTIENPNLLEEYSFSSVDFYGHHNGTMHLLVSNDYVGSSFSYFPSTTNRLQYGLNAGIIPIVQNGNSTYLRGEENRSLLIPLWFSVKIRLRTGYDDKLIPYFIGGLGPTLGLNFGPYGGFFNSINHLNGELGGGGYMGLGVDYLWAEDWAFSMDVRYNLFVFDQPVGKDKEFSGFSFFIGFARAFGF